MVCAKETELTKRICEGQNVGGGEDGAYGWQGPGLCGATVIPSIGSAPVRGLLIIESRSAKDIHAVNGS